jgi:hypothetical protein
MDITEIKALLNAWKDIDWPSPQHRKDQLDYILGQMMPTPDREALIEKYKSILRGRFCMSNHPLTLNDLEQILSDMMREWEQV